MKNTYNQENILFQNFNNIMFGVIFFYKIRLNNLQTEYF